MMPAPFVRASRTGSGFVVSIAIERNVPISMLFARSIRLRRRSSAF